MKNAFQQICQTHQKVVIIGSDCPSLTKEIINEAFEKLKSFPFVIGPAKDGGYYLLGMNQHSPTIFDNISWSTSHVFPKTIEFIERLNKTYYLLPELSDIDNEEDWKKHGWEI
jgi:rSAM/selenodomain-associated transferase 1